MKGLSGADQNEILRKFDTLEVSFTNLSIFMQTLSIVSENNTSHVNTINSKSKNSPTLVKSKLKSAAVVNGVCTRCNSNRKHHIDSVQALNKCDMSFCTICNKFVHTNEQCRGGFVNVVHGENASVSKPVSGPTPRINGHVTQDGSYKGVLTSLPDSGSVAKVMPIALATSLGLDFQLVSPNKYSLRSANGSAINIIAETSFSFEISPTSSLSLSVLLSDSLVNQELTL